MISFGIRNGSKDMNAKRKGREGKIVWRSNVLLSGVFIGRSWRLAENAPEELKNKTILVRRARWAEACFQSKLPPRTFSMVRVVDAEMTTCEEGGPLCQIWFAVPAAGGEGFFLADRQTEIFVPRMVKPIVPLKKFLAGAYAKPKPLNE